MYLGFDKKQFEEPICTVTEFCISDIITSSIGSDEDDWGIGLMPIGLP